MPCLLNVNLCTSCLCVYACLGDTINSTCGSAWWGRERDVGGRGETSSELLTIQNRKKKVP